MRNDSGLQTARARGGADYGRGKKFIPSWRTISSYLRSVSSNASNIATTVRTAGASIASSISQPDEEKREQVHRASFDKLELSSGSIHHVLLLTYMNGFQVWDVDDASNVREIVSKRDVTVAFLRLQPRPHPKELINCTFEKAHPLLLVVTGDVANRTATISGGFSGAYPGDGSTSGLTRQFIPTVVRFYSLQNHTYVHELRFRTGVDAVRCSSRVIAVALASQIHCFDAATLKSIFSVLTYPTPQVGLGLASFGNGAMALGPRWLAYASNQALMSSTGRVSPQQLGLSPAFSPSTSPGSGGYVQYAKESSKQLAAGVMTLGDVGYKTLSRYYSDVFPENVGLNCPGRKVTNMKSNSGSEYAGTVVVQDVVNKNIVAQFRAHRSPLSALCFDPSGTLLVTASVYGHNLNIFRLTPPATGHCGITAGGQGNSSYVHLYKLYRGLTNAVIQDITLSRDSHWIAVSSSRGTSHIFAISPFGGVVGPRTHGTSLSVDGYSGISLSSSASPSWSDAGPLRATQQTLHPPSAITLFVMARIKNGSSGWRGVACGDGNTGSGGAIAALFHDGGMHSENSLTGIWKDRLWVLSASGHLLRYSLRPSSWTEGGYVSSGMNSDGSSSSGHSQDLRLVVEPLEKWDVCRGLNWLEREERLEVFAGEPSLHEKNFCGASWDGLVGEKPVKADEELRRWYMSNAEVQINQSQAFPLWAQPNVFFHVILDRSLTNVDTEEDLHMEYTLSRVVEVRRKDLKPVMERFQRFCKSHGSVTKSSEVVTNVIRPRDITYGDAKLQNGLIESTFTMPIQRSSSGSSLGSECPLGEPNFGTNGFHPYPDTSEVYLAGNLYSSPPLQHGHHSMRLVPADSMLRQELLSSPQISQGDSARAMCYAHGQVNNISPAEHPSHHFVNTKIPNSCDSLINSTTGNCCLQTNLEIGLLGTQDGLVAADTGFQGHSFACSSQVVVVNQDASSSLSMQLQLVNASNLEADKLDSLIEITADIGAHNGMRDVEDAKSRECQDTGLQEQDGWEGDMFPFGEED